MPQNASDCEYRTVAVPLAACKPLCKPGCAVGIDWNLDAVPQQLHIDG